MTDEAGFYDDHYGHLEAGPHVEVRREIYGEDLGQASWMTAGEARRWFALLQIGRGRSALEVACGTGGATCAMARETGAACVGVDINPHGIEAARNRAERDGLSAIVSFERVDAGGRLPFPEESFDAVFCNDAINHLPGRGAVLRDWHRLLRPGGRVLFTDPIVVTGQISSEEMRARSSIGFFLFTPPGHNERLIEQAGFTLREVQDVTDAVASVSGRWRDARQRRRDALVPLEGAGQFEEFQLFLEAVRILAGERRLSRFMYLAEKQGSSTGESLTPPTMRR